MKKKNTYRRRPNNTGTVVKLSGNRRKPYAAKITTGYDPISGLQLLITLLLKGLTDYTIRRLIQ